MGFHFNPLVWFVCKLCRHTFPDADKLKAHKLEKHLDDCMGIKCIIFEEKFLDHEWFPADFHSESDQSQNSNVEATNQPLSVSPKISYQNPAVPLALGLTQLRRRTDELTPGLRLNNSILEPSCSFSGRAEPLTRSTSFFCPEDEDSPKSQANFNLDEGHNLIIPKSEPLDLEDENTDNGNSGENENANEEQEGLDDSQDNDGQLKTKQEPDSPFDSLSPSNSNDGLDNEDDRMDMDNGDQTSQETSSVSAVAHARVSIATTTESIPDDDVVVLRKVEFISRGCQTSTEEVRIILPSKNYRSAFGSATKPSSTAKSVPVPVTERETRVHKKHIPQSRHPVQSHSVQAIPIQMPTPLPNPMPLHQQPLPVQHQQVQIHPVQYDVDDGSDDNEDDDDSDTDPDFLPTSFLQQSLTIPENNVQIQIPGTSRASAASSTLQVNPSLNSTLASTSFQFQFQSDRKSSLRKPKPKPFICQDCGASFRKQNFLFNHMKCHEEDRPFKCPHCPAALTSKPGLKRHMIVHGKDTQHKCRFCGKSFNFKNVLDDHERTHTGERPFPCQVANCTESFSSKTALNMHTRRKHREELGLAQFECPWVGCSRAFGLKSEMNYHIIQVHQYQIQGEPTLYRCANDPCTSVYMTKQELDEHLQKECLFIY